jgi:poly-beta-1,6-N-acetyl-D-glucosamine synthase
MSIGRADRARNYEEGREKGLALDRGPSDTLVLEPISLPVDGSVVAGQPVGAGPAHDEPGTALLDMSAFWPEVDAIEADRLARRKPRVGHVLVLIPAHNEARSIADTLKSLKEQTLQPTEVVVVCDNCTDETAEISAANGARVMSTVGNSAKKAGALNQALACVLPQVGHDDLILTMDADSQLCRDWIQRAMQAMSDDPKVGAVCGVFLGENGSGLIGQLQRNEYVRYARQVARRNQAPVLSGTGTLFRVRALREVARERGHRLPDRPGQCYSTISITEDNEITLALKTIGYRCCAVSGCDTLTEVMPTWADLFRQRLRWQHGSLTDLRTYGITSVTARYWLKQIGLYLTIAATIATWLIMGLSFRDHVVFNVPWSIAIVSLALLDRLITVRKAGLRGILLAFLLIPELGYDIFRLSFFLRALYDLFRRREAQWNHLVVKDNA